MAKPTAKPWTTDGCGGLYRDKSKMGMLRREEDAAHIVKCVNMHADAVEALKAVLLFHSGVAWDYKAKIEWSKLVGPDSEATTKGMCDNIRTVLAKDEVKAK